MKTAEPRTSGNSSVEVEDSAVAMLQSLEEDRKSVFTDKEYRDLRSSVIEELCRGPVCRMSTLVTFGVIGGLLFSMGVLGVVLIALKLIADWTLVIVSAGSLAAWAYVLYGYRQGFQNHSHRSVEERLDELEQLRTHRLITQSEYERIYAAILMSRGTGRSK